MEMSGEMGSNHEILGLSDLVSQRRRNTGLGQSRGIAHRDVPRAAIAVMDEGREAGAAAVVDGSLERIQDEVADRLPSGA